ERADAWCRPRARSPLSRARRSLRQAHVPRDHRGGEDACTPERVPTATPLLRRIRVLRRIRDAGTGADGEHAVGVADPVFGGAVLTGSAGVRREAHGAVLVLLAVLVDEIVGADAIRRTE